MKTKVKILFFLPQLVGGGAEKVTINIMRLLDKNLFEVHLVVTDNTGPALRYLSEDIILHNLEVRKTMYSILKLRKLILELKPEIVFSSLIRGNIAMNLATLGLNNKPYMILRSPNSPKLLLVHHQINKLQKNLLEYAYKKANMVLAQTPEMQNELIQYHGIEKHKITVLLNPIDTDAIDDKIKHITNPFDNNYINVVAAGRVTYQKGFDILIKSFKYVVEQNSLFRLYIIGEAEGNELNVLLDLVKKYKLEEFVFFTGYQNNVYRCFYFSNLYVLSSRWEGLPNTVLENLYLEKPIISTTCIPYMNSLVQNGQNGFLVDVEDINGLAKAILNYKSLTLKFSKFSDPKMEINKFFKKIKVESV